MSLDHLDPLRDRDGGQILPRMAPNAVCFAPPSALPHEYAGAIFMAIALNKGSARQGEQALPGPVGLIGAGNLGAAIAHMPGSTFALEGDGALVAQLDRLVELLGGTPLRLRAEEKTLYHAAATVASNYTVTLAALAADLLVREGIAPDANAALG